MIVRSTDGEHAWAAAHEMVRRTATAVEYKELLTAFGPPQQGENRLFHKFIALKKYRTLSLARADGGHGDETDSSRTPTGISPSLRALLYSVRPAVGARAADGKILRTSRGYGLLG
jgi:hypothetical protein